MAIDLSAKKEELAKGRSNLSKTLVPGQQVCTITGITYRKNDYKGQDGLNISLQLEGEDLTAQGFEGFFLDQNNPDLGRHKGAVGRVELSQYSYTSKTGKDRNGKNYEIDRDASILSDVSKLASVCGKFDELMLGEVDDIVAFIEKASDLLTGSTLNFIVAGKEYEKNGYTQYNLFIPKAPKGFYAYEPADAEPSKLMAFNPNTLITRRAVAAPVESFEVAEAEFDIN
jgi:hypothetical protein